MNMNAVDVGVWVGRGEHGGHPYGDVIAMYIHLLYTRRYGLCSDSVEQESVQQDTVE